MILLLTGATGGFGKALLDSLCASDDVAEIYAVCRRSAPAMSAPKLRVLEGDITSGSDLGLPPAVAEELQGRLTGIVHAAADTRFSAPISDLRCVNVTGTAHTLAFAARCRRLDRLCVMSTVYVAGARTGTILEAELDHAAGFVNAYEQSKYEMETMARGWMTRLPVSVIRVSTVIGASSRRRPIALHQAIRLMYRSLAPMVPGAADHPVDLVPAEYAAPAAAWLATRGFQAGRTFHVAASSDTIPEGELLDLTIETFVRRRPAWRTRGIARPALVDLETFELFRQSVEAIGDSVLRDSTAVIGAFAPQLAYPKVFDDAACRAALAGSGIERPPVRQSYARMVEQLIEAQA